MRAEAEGKEKAKEFRERHRIGYAPIDDLVGLLDDLGIDVVGVPGGSNDHALTALDPALNALVIVASTGVPSVRFRSNLAHELGHIQFEEDFSVTALHSRESPEETRANAFARHLLLPLDAINAHSGNDPEEMLNWCVMHFGLSPSMAAIQLREAGLLKDSNQYYALRQWTTPKLADHYGWGILNKQRDEQVKSLRPPRILLKEAIKSYQSGNLPAVELAKLSSTSVDQVVAQHGVPEITALPFDLEDLSSDDLPENI